MQASVTSPVNTSLLSLTQLSATKLDPWQQTHLAGLQVCRSWLLQALYDVLLLLVYCTVFDDLPLHQEGTVYIQQARCWHVKYVSSNAAQRIIPFQSDTDSTVWKLLS